MYVMPSEVIHVMLQWKRKSWRMARCFARPRQESCVENWPSTQGSDRISVFSMDLSTEMQTADINGPILQLHS